MNQYQTKEHEAILKQIEELQRKKDAIVNETVLITIHLKDGDRRVSEPKYSRMQIEALCKPIDAQIIELQQKLLSIPLNLGTRIIKVQPIVYESLDKNFIIKWNTHKKFWYVAKTESLIGMTDFKVKTNDKNVPIQLSFLWQSSETNGVVYKATIDLKEQIDSESPRVPLPKQRQANIEIPTWKCTKCNRDYYIEIQRCPLCGTEKPTVQEPTPQPKEESGKLKRIRDMFSRD